MESKAEQYYPTYKATNRDVLLLEFEEANKIANAQIKTYGQIASLLIGGISIAITFFINNDKKEGALKAIESNSILFFLIIFVFGAFLLRYFVDLQKQITINARKVVTLRVLLGLDYGSIHLTLPNWRVEGATNPFVIKYFTGWFSFRSSPFWVLLISINLLWWLTTKDKENYNFWGTDFDFSWAHVIFTATYFYLFRTNLNDRHETNWLNIKKWFSHFVLGIHFPPNFEYILYRAKLSYLELDRLEVDYTEMKAILVAIEDKNFFENKGVSYKALFRSILSRFKYFRNRFGYIQSGGSTITMQLARTLFIRQTNDKISRKIVEIFLAYWLNKQFTKVEILKLYIASVQFEKGVQGLANAVKYFITPTIRKKILSKEESFFLVERLSNITSTAKWDRILYLKNHVKSKLDIEILEKIYTQQALRGNLKFLK